jgi:hypothetical protein
MQIISVRFSPFNGASERSVCRLSISRPRFERHSHRIAIPTHQIFGLASTSPNPYSAADHYQAKVHPSMMLLVVEGVVLINTYKER